MQILLAFRFSIMVKLILSPLRKFSEKLLLFQSKFNIYEVISKVSNLWGYKKNTPLGSSHTLLPAVLPLLVTPLECYGALLSLFS